MSEASNTSSVSASSGSNNFHPAFNRLRSEEIPSLNITMEEYEHKVTCAKHYHLASDNTENVFLVAFRTVPEDSTGVAHILEHTALCGSKKYPVRDPFFMMIRRSLNTFMNAFTSSDWTAYPFASKNKKDFNNLLDVYLDATFFARLHELDFAQEGHRLEFSEMKDSNSELQYKGVVFNEMKGAMSSTNSVLWQTISKYLFPTTTYHFNSGGEPDHIPDLSYQQLKDFYQSHYHPSNCVFMTFGDIPVYEHQQQFEDLALSKFQKLDIHIAVNNEKRYLSPLNIEENYTAEDEEEKQTHVVLGWLLGSSTQLDEVFKAELLSNVLLDNSSSPLLQALETSALGSAPSPMCGLEDSNREMSFMAGLEGCNTEDNEAVEKLIISTLEDLAENGVDQQIVESSLHQLELSQREISGDSYPYGLQLILMGLSTALHRGDPIKLLNIDPVLAQLREQIKDKNFIPDLIRSLILDNPHRVRVTLKPDSELANRKVMSEKLELEKIKSTLSTEQSEQIIQQSVELAQRQEQEDDPGILPKVGLDDVPSTITEPSAQDLKLSKSGSNATFYGQGTNGLCYQQMVVELPKLDEELLAALPLYSACVSEFGVGDKDYAEAQAWQARVSGGVNCFNSIRSGLDNVQQISGYMSYSSKCLRSNHKDLSQLLHDTVSNLRFDEDRRLHEVIEQICARKEASITGQGHSLAMSLASSRMSPSALLSHNSAGLEGIRNLKQLRKNLEDAKSREELMGGFQRLHSLILKSNRQFLLIAEPEHQSALLADVDGLWTTASPESASSLALPAVRENLHQAWITSTQVNFCSKAFPTVSSSHDDNAVLQVLAGFLRNGFLHRAIREQGGAYGGGASQDSNSASFRFFSYRDPRLSETLDDYDKAIQWMISGQHSEQQLEEAILGVIGSMDKPASPSGEAKQAFYNRLFDRSLEHRMAFRERVLSTSLADLKRVAEHYFVDQPCSTGVITSKEALEAANLDNVEIIHF
jgi:hypothetical protein